MSLPSVFRGAKTVGPFPSSQKPLRDRPGLYGRISKKGNFVFAFWTGTKFGLFSSDPKKAKAKADAGKFSRKDLPWFGFEQPKPSARRK